ncbi:glycosyltransferase [Hymenobacter seoulensis]
MSKLQKKITYIVSDVNKSFAMEWMAQYINSDSLSVSFILLNKSTSHFEKWLLKMNIPTYFVKYKSKIDFFRAFWEVRSLLNKIKPDIVHTHFLDANLVGLSASYSLSIKKRLYTRHSSTFHHVFFPKGVLYDKIINCLATDIIAISKVVRDYVLIKLEKVPSNKIHLIHHGIDISKFNNYNRLVVDKLRLKYNVNNHYPVIGVIARYIEWKGIQYIIPAFSNIKKNYPNALLVLANARGSYKNEVLKLLDTHLDVDSYREIQFEEELPELYQLFDIYVHVPISDHIEAFGLTYIESLAAKVPSIFTLSGIASEFIVNRKNALVVPFCDSATIENALEELLQDSCLRNEISEMGYNDVIDNFSIQRYIENLKNIYNE